MQYTVRTKTHISKMAQRSGTCQTHQIQLEDYTSDDLQALSAQIGTAKKIPYHKYGEEYIRKVEELLAVQKRTVVVRDRNYCLQGRSVSISMSRPAAARLTKLYRTGTKTNRLIVKTSSRAYKAVRSRVMMTAAL